MEGKKKVRPYTILIADDEPDIVETIEISLTLEGMTCIKATDGIEALKIIQWKRPDLILLDVMMPKMNGFELCRQLKMDDQLKKIPVLMLTAKVQGPDYQMGKEVKADAFIPKPFEMEDLLLQIRLFLSGSPMA